MATNNIIYVPRPNISDHPNKPIAAIPNKLPPNNRTGLDDTVDGNPLINILNYQFPDIKNDLDMINKNWFDDTKFKIGIQTYKHDILKTKLMQDFRLKLLIISLYYTPVNYDIFIKYFARMTSEILMMHRSLILISKIRKAKFYIKQNQFNFRDFVKKMMNTKCIYELYEENKNNGLKNKNTIENILEKYNISKDIYNILNEKGFKDSGNSLKYLKYHNEIFEFININDENCNSEFLTIKKLLEKMMPDTLNIYCSGDDNDDYRYSLLFIINLLKLFYDGEENFVIKNDLKDYDMELENALNNYSKPYNLFYLAEPSYDINITTFIKLFESFDMIFKPCTHTFDVYFDLDGYFDIHSEYKLNDKNDYTLEGYENGKKIFNKIKKIGIIATTFNNKCPNLSRNIFFTLFHDKFKIFCDDDDFTLGFDTYYRILMEDSCKVIDQYVIDKLKDNSTDFVSINIMKLLNSIKINDIKTVQKFNEYIDKYKEENKISDDNELKLLKYLKIKPLEERTNELYNIKCRYEDTTNITNIKQAIEARRAITNDYQNNNICDMLSISEYMGLIFKNCLKGNYLYDGNNGENLLWHSECRAFHARILYPYNVLNYQKLQKIINEDVAHMEWYYTLNPIFHKSDIIGYIYYIATTERNVNRSDPTLRELYGGENDIYVNTVRQYFNTIYHDYGVILADHYNFNAHYDIYNFNYDSIIEVILSNDLKKQYPNKYIEIDNRSFMFISDRRCRKMKLTKFKSIKDIDYWNKKIFTIAKTKNNVDSTLLTKHNTSYIPYELNNCKQYQQRYKFNQIKSNIEDITNLQNDITNLQKDITDFNDLVYSNLINNFNNTCYSIINLIKELKEIINKTTFYEDEAIQKNIEFIVNGPVYLLNQLTTNQYSINLNKFQEVYNYLIDNSISYLRNGNVPHISNKLSEIMKKITDAYKYKQQIDEKTRHINSRNNSINQLNKFIEKIKDNNYQEWIDENKKYFDDLDQKNQNWAKDFNENNYWNNYLSENFKNDINNVYNSAKPYTPTISLAKTTDRQEHQAIEFNQNDYNLYGAENGKNIILIISVILVVIIIIIVIYVILNKNKSISNKIIKF